MAKLKDYYHKKQLMEKLADELEKLEEDQSIKKDMEFKDRIQELLKEFDKTPSEALEVLTVIDPNLAQQGAAGAKSPIGPKRPMITYKNPHTGEVVKTRGGNQKTLKEWRKEYGREEVDSWKQ